MEDFAASIISQEQFHASSTRGGITERIEGSSGGIGMEDNIEWNKEAWDRR